MNVYTQSSTTTRIAAVSTCGGARTTNADPQQFRITTNRLLLLILDP